MIITCKPFDEMTLAELTREREKFMALMVRTTVSSARMRIILVLGELARWIDVRETG